MNSDKKKHPFLTSTLISGKHVIENSLWTIMQIAIDTASVQCFSELTKLVFFRERCWCACAALCKQNSL